MKARLYLETTIPSYLTARPSRDLIVAGHQQLTKDWWSIRRDSFEICISQFVLDEAGAGDAEAARERMEVLKALPLLEITDSVLRHATALLQSGIIPNKAAQDAAHIAISAVHGIDYLMTWNCSHIANAMIVRKVQEICLNNGFSCPVICTPEELMED
jgi:predicted nucleic acid-binding protein